MKTESGIARSDVGVNRTGEEALPLLVEMMCAHRNEPVAHIRSVDGKMRCLSSGICHRECDTKDTTLT